MLHKFITIIHFSIFYKQNIFITYPWRGFTLDLITFVLFRLIFNFWLSNVLFSSIREVSSIVELGNYCTNIEAVDVKSDFIICYFNPISSKSKE